MPAEFFQRYLPDPRLFRGYRHIQDAIDVYRAAREPQVAARLEAELQALMVTTERQTAQDALAGTKIMQETLRRRLVRPETAGPHLSSRIHSLPLPTELPAGAIGYGDIGQLDTAIDPDYPESGSYWRAQEYGSDAAVGRIVVGFFQPGFAAPSEGEFRRHPYFTAAGGFDAARGRLPGEEGSAPAMRIKRPIPAKHFLRDGAVEAVAEHESQMQRLQSDAIDAMLAATGGPRTR